MNPQTTALTIRAHAIDFLNPSMDAIVINDIAHVLARIPRYTGHTLREYSVAEHSLLVANLVEAMGYSKFRLHALLHDAAEAYTGDVCKPLKNAMRALMPKGEADPFSIIEDRIDNVIQSIWILNHDTGEDWRPIVDRADKLAYQFEVPALLNKAQRAHDLWDWVNEQEPIQLSFHPDCENEIFLFHDCMAITSSRGLSHAEMVEEYLENVSDAESRWREALRRAGVAI